MRKFNLPTSNFAIASVTLLEAIALFKGINGASFGIAIAIIAGLAGYKIKPPSKS